MTFNALPSKNELKGELARLLQAELEGVERAHRAALEAATHEEAKPENDKDTRALEQSYLARGQANRTMELRSAVAQVRALAVPAFRNDGPIGIGALVAIDEDGKRAHVLIAPRGGGSRLAQGAVLVVTPESPLGRALLGRRIGDFCEVLLQGRTREITVVDVS